MLLLKYTIAKHIHCLENAKTQSERWSWNDSLMLIDTLDEIRGKIGLRYQNHDIQIKTNS